MGELKLIELYINLTLIHIKQVNVYFIKIEASG